MQHYTVCVLIDAGGKSAVMNALSLGLGGKASATARGQNIADFIRRGNLCVTISLHSIVYTTDCESYTWVKVFSSQIYLLYVY